MSIKPASNMWLSSDNITLHVAKWGHETEYGSPEEV